MTASTELIADAMRAALRSLARSVSIISMRKDGENLAMTATALTEVSLAPASMLVCLNRESCVGRAIATGDGFAVNLLASPQQALSQACGGKATAIERFAFDSWQLDRDIPIITGACAAIELVAANVIPHGSHLIVVGNVNHVAVEANAQPLIYHAGGYCALAS